MKGYNWINGLNVGFAIFGFIVMNYLLNSDTSNGEILGLVTGIWAIINMGVSFNKH